MNPAPRLGVRKEVIRSCLNNSEESLSTPTKSRRLVPCVTCVVDTAFPHCLLQLPLPSTRRLFLHISYYANVQSLKLYYTKSRLSITAGRSITVCHPTHPGRSDARLTLWTSDRLAIKSWCEHITIYQVHRYLATSIHDDRHMLVLASAVGSGKKL